MLRGALLAASISKVPEETIPRRNQPLFPLQRFDLLFLDAGAMKLANKAALWYVPCSLQNVEKIMEVPPIKVEYMGNNQLQAGVPVSSPLGFSCLLLFDPDRKEMTRNELDGASSTSCACRHPVHMCTCSCVCSLCSMRVQSRRRRAENATKPRKRNGWKPKTEPKNWLRLLPTQVWRPEIEGFGLDTILKKVCTCLHSIVFFALQSRAQLASASLVSSIWWVR